MLLVRFVLIHIALVATVVNGQDAFPPPLTIECDPCTIVSDGRALSAACQDSNPIVSQIVSRDSACGRNWDLFCLTTYNDCYNQACGPARQGLIDVLASTGGPLGRPLDRNQIDKNCPPTSEPSPSPTQSPSSSPSYKPSLRPSSRPSDGPSFDPSSSPTISPSTSPSVSPSSSPSVSPTATPSESPTASPSETPTITPSISPSTPFPTIDPECEGRPWEITFLYNGGDCAQSDNAQARQKFDCTDIANGPPTNEGDESYITAVPRGSGNSKTNQFFFAGSVPVGEKYTLNAERYYDKLAADMTITIYDTEGGDIQQIVDVHLSCSQPLILFDKFGASEVTQWVETSGRVVSKRQSGVVTGVYESDLGVIGSF